MIRINICVCEKDESFQSVRLGQHYTEVLVSVVKNNYRELKGSLLVESFCTATFDVGE